MQLSRRLPRFKGKLDNLGDLLSTVDAKAERNTRDIYTAERALIQIQIEWEHYVRAVILDSATGSYSNTSGPVRSTIHPSISSREVAAHLLIDSYPNRQHEPDWYLPNQAIDAAVRLGISNVAQVSAELGITPWPIDELRHLRNFIAHRSRRSALSLRGTGIVPVSGGIDILNAAFQYGPGGLKRYSEWISFAKGAAGRLVA